MSVRLCWLIMLFRTSLLTDFLSICSVIINERIVKVFDYNYGFLSFPFQLSVFVSCTLKYIMRCITIWNYYTFLKFDPFIITKPLSSIPIASLVLRSTLSDSRADSPAFFMIIVFTIHIFPFLNINISVSLYFSWVFL